MNGVKEQANKMRLYPEPTDQLPPYLVDKYEREASKFWEKFYKRNGINFFKDRHYLDREFPQVANGAITLLEVGCGVGNAVFPLLEANPLATIYAVDFSAKAIDLLKNHELYDATRVHAHVADITTDALSSLVPSSSVDICTMVFVLSALSPDTMLQAIQGIACLLKPREGRVLFRDYAEGDLAEERLKTEGRQKKIADHFYVRGDGTRCFYFSEEFLRELFESSGFVCEDLFTHERAIENRAKKITMHRRWIQAVFKYCPPPQPQNEEDDSIPS